MTEGKRRIAAAFLVGALVILPGCTTSLDGANPSGNLKPGAVPAEYEAWVNQAGSICAAITPAAIAAQIEAESNWNPNAQSPVGASGLTQFMPGTWTTWGQDANGNGIVSPLDPPDAIMAQGNFMCALYDQVTTATADGRISGDPFDLALASYNAGFGNVTKYGGIPPFKETQNYVTKIRGLITKYSAPSTTGPIPGSSIGARIVAAGETQLGVPYSWGGGTVNGPSTGTGIGANTVGFDCSHFVQYAIYQASDGTLNVLPPSHDQANAGAEVLHRAGGTPVDYGSMQVGDIITFRKNGQGRYHHVGIYIGDGRMIHAPLTGRTVEYTTLADYWEAEEWAVRRVG
jgi:cell wall-associated NlpC family hydrolase